MGRGRQKAKHTKVARDLKYFSPDTNYGALEKELGGAGHATDPLLQEDLAAWPEYAGGEYAGGKYDEDSDDDFEDADAAVTQDKSA